MPWLSVSLVSTWVGKKEALEDRVTADRSTVLERLAAGQTPEEAEAEFLTDAYFEAWYDQTLAALSAFAG